MYINTTTLTQHSEQDIRAANPNTSFPVPFVAPEEYAYVFPSPAVYDPITQTATETTPVLTDKGHWEQAWTVTNKSAEVIATEAEAKALVDAAHVAAKIEALWKAADAYTSKYISGVAIGLLTMGVLQGKPKAFTVTAWSSSVWDAYYTRKAAVTATSADDLDFTSFGPIPHTVPELRAELGM